MIASGFWRALVVAALLVTSACVAPDGAGRKQRRGLSTTLAAKPSASPTPGAVRAEGRAGAVAAEHPRAAEIGLSMLERGGNAADAAIATAWAVCVLNASSCGVGGGGFMLVNRPDGSVSALDYRETAPALAHRDLYRRGDEVLPELSRRGGLAVAVPGEVAGLEAARERFARLPRDVLLAPAIALARDGFPLGPHLAKEIAQNLTALRAAPALAALFLDAAGNPRPQADPIRLPELAATLEHVARQGADGFYRGRIAQEIARAVREAGGILSTQDLASYHPHWRHPLRGTYRGLEIFTMPPPSSGGVIVEILNILAHDDLAALGATSAAYYHLLAEAMGNGFADRARWYGDPEFTPVPIERLTSPAYGAMLRARITPDRTLPQDRYGTAPDAGTTHVSVVDAEGMAVACTSTINTAFGAMLVAGSTGVILNNEMDDFSVAPGVPNSFGLIGGEANSIAAGKRPLSSMTPIIARADGRPRVVAGGSGGPLIISATLQTLLGILDFGLDPAAAIAAPRIHQQWAPPSLISEAELDPTTAADLTARGHVLRRFPFAGAVQVVVARDGLLIAAADPRKNGGAAAR
ncbi:MAG: gamma-glutamyltransferase [Deltaproteobacteria bacterium]|nr:gamma-glutamyltransferase [Deltaproteobacteria bacterium]